MSKFFYIFIVLCCLFCLSASARGNKTTTLWTENLLTAGQSSLVNQTNSSEPGLFPGIFKSSLHLFTEESDTAGQQLPSNTQKWKNLFHLPIHFHPLASMGKLAGNSEPTDFFHILFYSKNYLYFIRKLIL